MFPRAVWKFAYARKRARHASPSGSVSTKAYKTLFVLLANKWAFGRRLHTWKFAICATRFCACAAFSVVLSGNETLLSLKSSIKIKPTAPIESPSSLPFLLRLARKISARGNRSSSSSNSRIISYASHSTACESTSAERNFDFSSYKHKTRVNFFFIQNLKCARAHRFHFHCVRRFGHSRERGHFENARVRRFGRIIKRDAKAKNVREEAAPSADVCSRYMKMIVFCLKKAFVFIVLYVFCLLEKHARCRVQLWNGRCMSSTIQEDAARRSRDLRAPSLFIQKLARINKTCNRCVFC